MSEKIWQKRTVDPALVDVFTRELALSPLMATLLSARQVSSVAEARKFLSPELKQLLDPAIFKDMDKAVMRLAAALKNGEAIGIFGDYDVDGVCSSALLQQFLSLLGGKVCATLPNRMTEGYGLSTMGVDRLHAQGATVLVTADCGSLDHEEIEYAGSLGMDVIVVDHHNVSDLAPKAFAFINPKQPDCPSAAHYLCAAGVAFFLCAALRRHLRELGYFDHLVEPDLKQLLDLVALATVCDVVPLVKDNRSLVKAGLRTIQQGSRVGLNGLMDVAGIDKHKISSTNLGFHLGPRINAAGRLEDATAALQLMNCSDVHTAKDLAEQLQTTNQERRALEEITVEQACKLLDSGIYEDHKALVLHDEAWHPGVVGIVASRIAERYYRPTIIIGKNGKGSGRSIKGIDLHEMVSKAAQSLAGFGGHGHAIGLTLGVLGAEVFRADLQLAMQEVPKRYFQKELLYDADLPVSEINLALIEQLTSLEPFGAKNPYPVIRINRCFMRNLRRLNGGHIKGELETNQGSLSFIGFRMDIADELASNALDILGVLEKNEWQGRISAQLRLIDYRES